MIQTTTKIDRRKVKLLNDITELERISKIISESTGITVDEMKDRTRKEEIRIARHVAMWFCDASNCASVKFIGHFFHRDHSTIINAREKIEEYYQTNNQFRKNMNILCELVNPSLKPKLEGLIK